MNVELWQVSHAALCARESQKQAERDQAVLVEMLRKAHREGQSLRALAKAAELSHQRIHQLTN